MFREQALAGWLEEMAGSTTAVWTYCGIAQIVVVLAILILIDPKQTRDRLGGRLTGSA